MNKQTKASDKADALFQGRIGNTKVFWSISGEQMVFLSFWMGRGVKKGRLGPTFHLDAKPSFDGTISVEK